MSDELVLYEVRGGIALLTLNRPDRRNALSPQLVEALRAALRRLAEDEEAVVAVLTGAGDKAFCAGGDLAAGMASTGALEARRSRAAYAELLAELHACGKPVVAACQGDALGGGFGLALACDLVVVEPSARLGTPEIKLGLFPMIILAELSRNMPRKRLLEMVLTGRSLSPDEALAWNLVNRVSAAGGALEEAMALAASIACHSPAVLRLGKDAVYRSADLDHANALLYLHEQLEANLQTEDAMEGIGAFLQKRKPSWKGR